MSTTTPNEKSEAYAAATPYSETTTAPSSTTNDEATEKEESYTKEGGHTAAVTDDEDNAAKDAPTDGDDDNLPTGWKLAVIVIALVLSVFFFSLDQTIVATAIPKITDEFNSLDDISWYGSAFFMTLGAFQSTWGKGYKYFSLKLTFLLAIFIFELGSLICAVAPTSTALIIGRAIAGVGAAGIGSGSYTIVAFAAKPKMRPTFTGLIGAAYGVAAVAGPLIGGVFADKITWRWCFWINLPLGGFSAGIIVLFFSNPPAAQPVQAPLREKLLQMDPLGTTMVMGAITSCLLALQYGGASKAWNSATVVGLLVGFVLMSVAFGILEWKQGERAMLTARLFRNRNVWVNCVYGFFFAGSYFVPLYYLPIYFQSIDDVNPSQSGVRNLPLIIAFSLFTILSGGFISKTGISTPILPVGAAVATVGAGLLYTLDIGTGSGKWIGYQILIGFAYGIAFQVPMIVAQSTLPPADLASGTAMILFFQTIGGAFLLGGAQAGFVNELLAKLPTTAPSVNPQLVVATGATELREVFGPEVIGGVLRAYMDAIKLTMAITIAGLGISFVLSLLSKWNKINTAALTGGAA